MSVDTRWYVVHTYSGYENKVKTNIEKVVENRNMHNEIFEVKIPTETVTEIVGDKRREVERKLFPDTYSSRSPCIWTTTTDLP